MQSDHVSQLLIGVTKSNLVMKFESMRWTGRIKPGLILSVQSNQFVQSKIQFVQSKMRNCAVQKHKVKDIIVQFSKSYCCAVQDAAFF